MTESCTLGQQLRGARLDMIRLRNTLSSEKDKNVKLLAFECLVEVSEQPRRPLPRVKHWDRDVLCLVHAACR